MTHSNTNSPVSNQPITTRIINVSEKVAAISAHLELVSEFRYDQKEKSMLLMVSGNLNHYASALRVVSANIYSYKKLISDIAMPEQLKDVFHNEFENIMDEADIEEMLWSTYLHIDSCTEMVRMLAAKEGAWGTKSLHEMAHWLGRCANQLEAIHEEAGSLAHQELAA